MSEVNSVKDTGEMMNDLEEYYEAAGFADFHKNVLSTMDERLRFRPITMKPLRRRKTVSVKNGGGYLDAV